MQWWQRSPSTRYATPTGITLPSTGVQDIEKGDIYSLPAGSPVSIPTPARVAWEDSQHVVLTTSQGILNFLHVNPTQPVGSVLASNQPFGDVSPVGSPGHPSTYFDSNSGITYTESGNIIEFGSYDTVERAKARENFAGGLDQPADFTGIYDPSKITATWQGGKAPQVAPPPSDTLPTTPTTSPMNMSMVWLLVAAVAIFMIWKVLP